MKECEEEVAMKSDAADVTTQVCVASQGHI